MNQPRSNFLFFWGHPFSQWGIYPFLLDGVRYNTCEQFMMAEKARLFGDAEIERKIMSTADPKEQKELGRQVRGFDKAKWEAAAREIVYRANLAKFSQNESVYDLLMGSGNKMIVEAAPDDKIWGIGLRESDPRVCDPEKWLGTNWLGEAIMRVRAELRASGEKPDNVASWVDVLAEKVDSV